MIKLTPNSAHIKRTDKPEGELLLVAIDRLRRCPNEVAEVFWPPDRSTQKQVKSKRAVTRCQKKHQLRAANLTMGGSITLTRSNEHIYTILYCICML